MNDQTFSAFGDELTKIAFYQKMRTGFVNALKEGWHGTKDNPQTWLGQGEKITPGMGRAGRAVERFTSLGGLTKALPVGGKSLMLLGTLGAARQAMRPVDPTGHDRSRSERVTGLAGNTVGGLVGSALAMKAMPGSGILAPMLGGMAGGMVGERLVTSPFRLARSHRAAQQQPMQEVPPQYYQQMQPPPEGAY